MLATPHAAVGAAIGRWTGRAWLALPLAYVSHWALDMLPHLEATSWPQDHSASTFAWAVHFGIDLPLFVLLLWWLVRFGGRQRGLLIAAALAAVLPDVIGMFRDLPVLDALIQPLHRPHWLLHRSAAPEEWLIGITTQLAALAAGLLAVAAGKPRMRK